MTRTPQQRAESLLNALDPLAHPQRMRELALRVREMDQLRPVLEALEARGPYERGIAVVAASVGRDDEWIAERIADPDAFVRGHALRVADSLQVPDFAYESALDDAPEVVRRELLRAIVAGRRTALADRLVDALRREWGDAEAARLLPGCAPETVARLLPELFHAVTGWKALAERHPGALLDVAERELSTLPEGLRETWWDRYARGVAATVAVEPLRVFDLLERFGPPATLPHQLRDRFGEFASAEPGRLLRLLLTPAGLAALRGGALSPAVLQPAGPLRRTRTRRVRTDPGRVGRTRAARESAAAGPAARLLPGRTRGPGSGTCHPRRSRTRHRRRGHARSAAAQLCRRGGPANGRRRP